MDKQQQAHSYKGTVLRHTMEYSTNPRYGVTEPQKYYPE